MTSAQQAKRARQKDARRRRKGHEALTVYHGTVASHLPAIRRNGLVRPEGRDGPYVTTNLTAAKEYAVRACCHLLHHHGIRDYRALVVQCRLPLDALKVDHAGDSADWLVPHGVLADQIEVNGFYDCAKHLDNTEWSTEVARRVECARALEASKHGAPIPEHLDLTLPEEQAA